MSKVPGVAAPIRGEFVDGVASGEAVESGNIDVRGPLPAGLAGMARTFGVAVMGGGATARMITDFSLVSPTRNEDLHCHVAVDEVATVCPASDRPAVAGFAVGAPRPGLQARLIDEFDLPAHLVEFPGKRIESGDGDRRRRRGPRRPGAVTWLSRCGLMRAR